MGNPALLKWIEQEKAKGHSLARIKQYLISNGYTKNQVDAAFSTAVTYQAPKKKVVAASPPAISGYGGKIAALFSKPSGFFMTVEKEYIWPAFLMLIFMSGISAIICVVIGFVFCIQTGGAPPLYIIGSGFSLFIAEIIFGLLFTGIIHFLAVMLGGTGSFGMSHKIFAYSMVPFQLTKFVPFVNIFGVFYSLALMVVGFMKLKTLSQKRALIAVLSPILLVLFLWLVILAIEFFKVAIYYGVL